MITARSAGRIQPRRAQSRTSPLNPSASSTLRASVGDAGAASGLLNSSRQAGGALGLAALVNIAATATSHDAARAGYAAGLVHGYHVAFAVNAGIMVAAGLVALPAPARSGGSRQPREDG